MRRDQRGVGKQDGEQQRLLLAGRTERGGLRLGSMDNGEIRFVPIADGRGPGISAFDVRVVDRDRVLAAAKKRHKQHHIGQVEVCGCRINLV